MNIRTGEKNDLYGDPVITVITAASVGSIRILTNSETDSVARVKIHKESNFTLFRLTGTLTEACEGGLVIITEISELVHNSNIFLTRSYGV